jgi:hypothetical protein
MCPVCGYELGFEPWQAELPSDEISPCCGTQFGYDDHRARGRSDHELYRQLREDWIANGMSWWSKSTPPPRAWDAVAQLTRLTGA